jgi:hypothetical protein
MPMSMPYLFEDPFITTGANLVGIWTGVDERRDFQGADIGVLALQLRVALTDKLAFIATKDGFAMYRPDTKISDVPALGDPTNNKQLQADEDAFLNATIGFKYAMVEIPELNFILTRRSAMRFHSATTKSSRDAGTASSSPRRPLPGAGTTSM